MGSATSDVDDYAAEPVPEHARTGPLTMLAGTLGIGTALIYMQVSSVITLRFGTHVGLIAIVYATLVSGLVGYGIARAAIESGFGTNLLARQLLGTQGASLFSLLFGANALVYFMAEASIMGASFQSVLPGTPIWAMSVVVVVALILVVWFGLRILARLQALSFVLYGVLLLVALYISLHARGPSGSGSAAVGHADIPLWSALLQAVGTMNGITFVTALVTADYARYVRRSNLNSSSLIVGAGFQFFAFAISGFLGFWFSQRYGQDNPGVYFVEMLGGLGVLFAVATQLRINAANLYMSSLAFVNFFRQVGDVHVSRHLLTVVCAILVCVGLFTGLVAHLSEMLNIIGVFSTCATVLILADWFALRNNGARIAAARWRPSAIFSLLTSTFIGCLLESGLLGSIARALASLISGAAAIVIHWLIAKWTDKPALPDGSPAMEASD